MGSKTCSVTTTAANTLNATVTWDSNLKVTASVYTTAHEWRLKKRGYSGNTGIVYGPRTTISEDFTFTADDGGEYIFQALDDLSYEYENNSFDVSGFTVNSDSSGGDSGDDDSGGSSDNTYYIYYSQGVGTSLNIDRTWNESTGESYKDYSIDFGTEIVWKDVFAVTVSVLDGYQDLKVAFTNFDVTEQTANGDGSLLYRGTMEYEGDILISTSATKTSGNDSGNTEDTNNGSRRAVYIGINNIAHKIKRGYIGIDNVARKIKKAYIGIGGFARPCWGSGEVTYYGQATGLSVVRRQLSATHIGNHALFAGGQHVGGNGYDKDVDAYDTSLTRTTPTRLSTGRYDPAATHIGNFALFGGGYGGSSAGESTVDAYDASLTRTTPTGLSNPRYNLSATYVGNYALFAGGVSNNGIGLSIVDAYDTSLTRTVVSELIVGKTKLAATHISNYAIFAGGSDGYGPYSSADAYDRSLTMMTPTFLSIARYDLSATHVGKYAIFAGGRSEENKYKDSTVDVYNESLTKTVQTELSVGRMGPAATHIGNFALFGGGGYVNDTKYSTVDAYDISFTRTIPTELSIARFDLAATSIGDYALFAGGEGSVTNSSGYYDCSTVDVYTVI